jgi:hypothetical protein
MGTFVLNNPYPITSVGPVSADLDDYILNPMHDHGDMIYGGVAGLPTRVAGNTTTDTMFLSQVGAASIAGHPTWVEISSDLVTYDGDEPNVHDKLDSLQAAIGAVPSGAQGTQGLQGIQGISVQGTQGTYIQGTQGTTGLQGIQGQAIQGTAGGASSQGTTGSQGPQGPQGISGTEIIQGTPSAQQVTTWYDATNIEGSSALTFDGTTLHIHGSITATGEITAYAA